jgi:hypothetical protein
MLNEGRTDVFPLLHDVVSRRTRLMPLDAEPIGTSANVCSCGDVKLGQSSMLRWRVDIIRKHAEHSNRHSSQCASVVEQSGVVVSD